MEPKVVQLNLEGEICPYTLTTAIKKSEEIKGDLKAGEKILQVLVDHPPVVDNFPTEFQGRGYQVEIKKLSPAKWQVVIKK